ncbi:DNA gyrase/topoisomerase IV subunit A [Georgenia sp. Z1491]|uniref:DNA gyrase/topoisomerase IV subunit A n=1 Tax=Georgenia sp. Z1491 TaxID=3416707 RepID=UPI003CEE012D
MPRTAPPVVDEHIVDIDVAAEMEGSFLEYAYSVIYARALPDARDGLKPVQRRILYQMDQMGLRPDRAHVKSSRVVGDVMGKLHPHGDTAIYDAMVRLAQDFAMRLPVVDGHGNFGSLDDGPAAPRYTEVRQAPAAVAMVADLGEDVVDLVPNYDGSTTQPEVLPAAWPNLLVNGASGIAVGMATNMAPHNLVEVVAAARHLVAHPDASLEALQRFVPGPDLPGGGRIVGLEGVREAQAGGRGSFRTRATVRVEQVTPRKKGIVVTELPYMVGTERVIGKIKDGVDARRIEGITGVVDLTDRHQGLRLVIELKTGFNPDAVLEQLYRYTPLEESFSINNVALVEGRPRTLGLKEMLEVYVDHRLTVTRRRSEHRLRRARERSHLLEGLLAAVLNIDEVVQLIRSAESAEAARTGLMTVFDLTAEQATYILDLQLRRLTRYSVLEIEGEHEELLRRAAELEEILGSDQALRSLVSAELAEVAKAHGTPRRTVLLESAGGAPRSGAEAAAVPARGRRGATAAPLEEPDDPCWVLLGGTGRIARTPGEDAPPRTGDRVAHDAVTHAVATTARSDVGIVTSAGRVVRLEALHAPALPGTTTAPGLSGGTAVEELVALEREETVVGLVGLGDDAPTVALATASGVVKRVSPADRPASRESWDVIALADGDSLVAARHAGDDDQLVLVSSDAQLLRFDASLVRPTGRSGKGVAGIRLAAGARLVHMGVAPTSDLGSRAVVTIAGPGGALPGTTPGSAKVTPLDRYPAKGRATGGVRAHRFLRGEDELQLAWVGPMPVRAVGAGGQAVDLPEVDERRDGSGHALSVPVAAIG